MNHSDWEMLEQKYDRDFVTGLDLLKRIDLDQFVIDLQTNDKETFDRLRLLMNRYVNENKHK